MKNTPKQHTRIRAVLDTDTYNEIDDQFALAHLLKSDDIISTEAIYAAPFQNKRADSAQEGMIKSYEEIETLLQRLNCDTIPFFKGSTQFLTKSPKTETSDAVKDLITRASSASSANPLYIIAIGALTNIANAIMIEPSLVDTCNVIWLGGHDLYWPHNREFNLQGDIQSTKIVFDSGIPLTVVPCLGVSSHLTSSREELATYIDLADPLCAFLYQRFSEYIPEGMGTKEIWDLGATAVLILPESVHSYMRATPRIAEDGSYILDPTRKPCRWVYALDRDMIFSDLYKKLTPVL